MTGTRGKSGGRGGGKARGGGKSSKTQKAQPKEIDGVSFSNQLSLFRTIFMITK